MDAKDQLIQNLMAMNLKLMEWISFLEVRVLNLKNERARYRNPKNSRNSSIPPSKDENSLKKNQSLWENTDRKSGGQPGHPGNTLEITAFPDTITDHIPSFYSDCGGELFANPVELSATRQVLDLPSIKPICGERRSYAKICACGQKNKAAFPEGINAPIQYGAGIEAMVSYLHSRQYVPYKRMKELLKTCFGLEMSEGSIANIIERVALKAAPLYDKLKTAVCQSPVIGADETGAKVNGSKHWVWTYQTEKLTVLALSESRGLKAIKVHFPDGFGNAILCHDGWRAYFKYSDNRHQLCCAHLIRDINYIIERYHSNWAKSLKILFTDAISLKKKLDALPDSEKKSNIEKIESRMNELLKASQYYRHKEGLTLQ